MTLKPLLLGATGAVAIVGNANATGWYASLEAGVGQVADTAAVYRESGGPTLTTITEGRFDNGWVVIAAVGYALQNWRIEGEVGWRSNDKEQFLIALPSTGSLSELTAMYNMTYAFQLAGGVDLALGGGAGIDYAMLDIVNLNDGDLNFAYQGIAQVNVAIARGTELTIGYRYLHVLDPEFEEASATPSVNVRFEDFDKHAVTLGVRYTFAP